MDRAAATELNERQRQYLQAIFDVDQAVEAEVRAEPYRPFQRRPKASEWRWLEYSEPIPILDKPGSRLWKAIKAASKIDQGTGSTFTALAERGLVRVSSRGLDGYTHLRMTTAGRKLVRSWTGATAYKPPPPGTLREWHWRALVRFYVAADEGLSTDTVGYRTLDRLQTYKRGKLVTDSRHSLAAGEYRAYITAYGRAFYAAEHPRYRELYPDVEAPAPSTGPSKSGAET